MNAQATVLILLSCVAITMAAGCTTGSPSGPATVTTPSVAATMAPETPAGSAACTAYDDCVPAQCCHPSDCTGTASAPSCEGTVCTMNCEGPLDCGAGSCGCVDGTCAVIPASSVPAVTIAATVITLEASPQRYSPIMSSTPGVALTPIITGFVPAETTIASGASDFAWDSIQVEWDATFGEFVAWEAPDYKVYRLGNPAATGEKTVYWTFTEAPASTGEPVTITVTARDMTRQGAVLGISTVTLDWDGDSAVYVGKIT